MSEERTLAPYFLAPKQSEAACKLFQAGSGDNSNFN